MHKYIYKSIICELFREEQVRQDQEREEIRSLEIERLKQIQEDQQRLEEERNRQQQQIRYNITHHHSVTSFNQSFPRTIKFVLKNAVVYFKKIIPITQIQQNTV